MLLSLLAEAQRSQRVSWWCLQPLSTRGSQMCAGCSCFSVVHFGQPGNSAAGRRIGQETGFWSLATPQRPWVISYCKALHSKFIISLKLNLNGVSEVPPWLFAQVLDFSFKASLSRKFGSGSGTDRSSRTSVTGSPPCSSLQVFTQSEPPQLCPLTPVPCRSFMRTTSLIPTTICCWM